MMRERVIARVQVHDGIRRPVASDVFLAVEVVESQQTLRVRGRWSGSSKERTYVFPWPSVKAVHHTGAD
jgi:hypothetical protein